MSANYADLTSLIEDLESAAENAEQAGEELLLQAGQGIAADAKSRAPVDTGNLANSIAILSHTPGRVVVGPDPLLASYGAAQEYGTGTRGEFPGSMYEIKPKTASVLVFKVGNKTVYARSVKHPGVAAQPYMRPALTAWVESLGEDMAKVGVQLIVGPGA